MSLKNYICHIEIPAPNLEKAAAFYESVFGWKVMRNIPFEGYWLWAGSDERCGGGLDSQKKVAELETGSQFFVECDIEATLKKVEKAGGTVRVGKREISPDHGFDAYVVDPNGVHFGLHEGN